MNIFKNVLIAALFFLCVTTYAIESTSRTLRNCLIVSLASGAVLKFSKDSINNFHYDDPLISQNYYAHAELITPNKARCSVVVLSIVNWQEGFHLTEIKAFADNKLSRKTVDLSQQDSQTVYQALSKNSKHE